MYFSIRHMTEFNYSAPITESVMEIRMQPRAEDMQRCLSFRLEITPRTTATTYRDYLGNHVHHFDIPERHKRLLLIAESLVEIRPPLPVPDSLSPSAWDELDILLESADVWESLTPSHFARPTALLYQLAQDLNITRRDDPLSLMREINSAIYDTFTYKPNSTQVDSPIDDALSDRQGVCQDYAHIMIALARELRIPCRYVSGYLFHREDDRARTANDASHAWVEALLPGLGWVGFDPTNNVLAQDRHIRVAVGRDYMDVPPTRGVYKGKADTELKVSVRVYPTEKLPPPEELTLIDEEPAIMSPTDSELQQIQQQQ